MAGFWDLSDGGSASQTNGEYEIPSWEITPIPDGSTVIAAPDAAVWQHAVHDDKSSPRHVLITWSVLAPDAYKNRKIFHRLWVDDLDPAVNDRDKAIKKRDKARKMLATIDYNAGGKLARSNTAPDDADLSIALCDKPMAITLRVWEQTERNDPNRKISGNWVCAVSPKSKGVDIKEDTSPKAASSNTDQRPSGARMTNTHMDDEIPF